MLRPLLRPLLVPPLRVPTALPVRSFSLRDLFRNGEQGGWWDPSDFSTMFQDSAGTIPVTAAGQPVGLIRDKSGRGNHALQATAASRPVLQQDASGFYYLSFDGVDDWLATAGSVDLSTTNKLTVVAGAKKQSDAAFALLTELTVNSGTTDGGFGILLPNSVAPNYASFLARGTGAANNRVAQGAALAAPVSLVMSCAFDLSAALSTDQIVPRINGATPSPLTAGSATTVGSFANAQLFIGRRAGSSASLNGGIYGLAIRGAASTAAQIAQTERHVGSRMGIAL